MDTKPTTRQPYTNHAGVDVSADLFNNGFRAPTGGCFGLTGMYYEGGQFLPSSERPAPKPSFKGGDAPAPDPNWDMPFRVAYAISQEPHNAFVIEFLRLHFARPTFEKRLMTTGELLTPERVANLADEPHLICPQFLWDDSWAGGFARSIHDDLFRYAKRPSDLSDRQFDRLADLYAKRKGARRGSKAYNTEWDAFCDKALPEGTR